MDAGSGRSSPEKEIGNYPMLVLGEISEPALKKINMVYSS
jgi:hypothetical protein